MELNQLFDLVQQVHDRANVATVFGPPEKVGEKTIIPIGRVSYGFGLGFGEGTGPTPEPSKEDESPVAAGGRGGGSGVGMMVIPLAVLEVTPESTRLEPVLDETKIASMVMLTIVWCVFWVVRAAIKIFGRQ
ncbi:MAG: GerW family sporulation protein [Chloroflexota bacterium]